MEYENMRMPELKSLSRDRRLRNCSQMRKAELELFSAVRIHVLHEVKLNKNYSF